MVDVVEDMDGLLGSISCLLVEGLGLVALDLIPAIGTGVDVPNGASVAIPARSSRWVVVLIRWGEEIGGWGIPLALAGSLGGVLDPWMCRALEGVLDDLSLVFIFILGGAAFIALRGAGTADGTISISGRGRSCILIPP